MTIITLLIIKAMNGTLEGIGKDLVHIILNKERQKNCFGKQKPEETQSQNLFWGRPTTAGTITHFRI